MTENKKQNELILKEDTQPTTKNQLVVKSDQNSSIVRSNLYNTDLVEYGVYKNFNYVDISTIQNLSKKFIIYNLPDVNDDEIKDFLITLLNTLSPNLQKHKSFNPLISFDKRDEGEYYIIEVERHEQVIIMKNLDGIEWLNHRIRIESPKDFFKDYNDTKGQIAIRQKINESKLFSNLAQENLNKNSNKVNNNKYNFNRLLMTGLPNNIEEKEVKKIVESYGQVKYFNLINKKNNDDISYTLCFFEYELPQNTYKALKGLNNMTFAERQLKVQRINQNSDKENLDNDIEDNNNNGLKNATIATQILKEAKQMEEIKRNEKELNDFINKNSNINKDAENINKEDTVFKDLNEEDKNKRDKDNISYNDLIIPEFAKNPSRVVMFINAISPEDLLDDSDYEEIIDDFRQKCSIYGTVLNVEIPRPNIEEGTYTEDVGKIFVKFSTLKTAKIARYNISGLKYNNRMIVGSFYPENYFDIREYNHTDN